MVYFESDYNSKRWRFMKYCSNCNMLIEDDSQIFCTKCGKPLEEKNICPRCHTENSPDFEFCIKCGTALKKQSSSVGPQPPLTFNKPIPEHNGNDNKKLIVLVVAVLVIAGAAFYFLRNSEGINRADSSISEPKKSTSQSEIQKPPAQAVIPPTPKVDNATPTPTFPRITTQAIVSAKHSSADQEGSYIHSATLAIDGNTKTCWSEGAPGLGLEEFIDIRFDGTYTVRGMNIWIGHQKSLDLFYQNARPSMIKVIGSDGSNEIYQLKDSFGGQQISFDYPISVSSIKLVILGAWSGSKYKDTCIAEVNFF